MADRHPPLYLGHRILWRVHRWTNGEASALARVVAYTRDRHGAFVHRSAYGVLCRQWTAPACLALLAAVGTLDTSEHRWASDSDLGTNPSSAHTTSTHLIKERHLTAACARTRASIPRGQFGPLWLLLATLAFACGIPTIWETAKKLYPKLVGKMRETCRDQFRHATS